MYSKEVFLLRIGMNSYATFSLYEARSSLIKGYFIEKKHYVV